VLEHSPNHAKVDSLSLASPLPPAGTVREKNGKQNTYEFVQMACVSCCKVSKKQSTFKNAVMKCLCKESIPKIDLFIVRALGTIRLG